MIKFLLDEKFLIPFLSTLGASMAIIIGQQIFGFSSRQRKKLYCINYISDAANRLLNSNLIIKKHTVLPHIVAAKKILTGDSELLDNMFIADEFDILNSKGIEFNHLPDEYKLLVGYDSMSTLQTIEFFQSLLRDDSAKTNLNGFVKLNLKSEFIFNSKTPDEKNDILNTYWDYLDNIDRQIDRVTGFIINLLIPTIETYKKKRGFLLFPTKGISKNIEEMKSLGNQFKDLIPSVDDMKNTINNGIQKVL